MQDLEDIMFYAFRYALGRSTYAVSTVAQFLIDNKEILTDKTQATIHKEVIEAIKHNMAGMHCDEHEWLKVLEAFKVRSN